MIAVVPSLFGEAPTPLGAEFTPADGNGLPDPSVISLDAPWAIPTPPHENSLKRARAADAVARGRSHGQPEVLQRKIIP